MARLETAIREAIKADGRTRYRLAMEAGVAQSQLSRFFRGKAGLSADTIERLANVLGLEIIVRQKRQKGK